MQMLFSLIFDTMLWSALCFFAEISTTNITNYHVLDNKRQLLSIAKLFALVENT